MSALEVIAIELHDYLWENVGVDDEWMSDEWPLQIKGDEEATGEVVRLMNALQEAIVASGYGRREYCPKRRMP